MKIWKKVKITTNKNKQVNLTANALTNYIYKYGPISQIISKYKIDSEDVKELNAYTTNRIAGLLLLCLARDTKRINDIANKYNNYNTEVEIIPEIEGYIDK